MSKKPRSRETIAEILIIFMMALACGSCAAVGYFYDRFTEVYAMKGTGVHQKVGFPYDNPIVAGDKIYLSRYENGSLDLGEIEFFIDRKGSLPSELVLIAYQDTPLKATIYLKNYREAVAGKWRGVSASMETTGAIEGDFPGSPGQPDEEWGGSLPSSFQGITPYFTVSIPINEVDLSADFNDRLIIAQTHMEVVLPYGSGPGTFKQGETEISHLFKLLVLSPDEVSRYKELRRNYRLIAGLPPLLITILVLIVSIAVLIGLWRAVGKLINARS